MHFLSGRVDRIYDLPFHRCKILITRTQLEFCDPSSCHWRTEFKKESAGWSKLTSESKRAKKKKKCLLYYIKEILKNNETILCHRLWKEIDYNFGIEQQLWSQGRWLFFFFLFLFLFFLLQGNLVKEESLFVMLLKTMQYIMYYNCIILIHK